VLSVLGFMHFLVGKSEITFVDVLRDFRRNIMVKEEYRVFYANRPGQVNPIYRLSGDGI
jgi:hypothetical protein